MKRAMILAAMVTVASGCSGSSSSGSTASSSGSSSTTARSSASSASTVSSSGSTTGASSASSSASGSTSGSGSTSSGSSGSSAAGASGSGSGSGSTGDVQVQVTTYTPPTGAALRPTDPSKPGAAKPAGLLALSGKIWVVLGNLDPNTFAPAGDSFLYSIDEATSAGGSYELTGCKNAQYLAAVGTDLIVTCTGTYNAQFASNDDGSAVRFDTIAKQVTQSYATKGSPGAVTVVGNTALITDALHNSLIALDLVSNTISVPGGGASICQGSAYLAFIASALQGTSSLAICGDPSGNNNTAEQVATDGGVIGTPVGVASNAVAAAARDTTPAGDEYLVLAANGNASGPILQSVIASGSMLTLTQAVVQLPAGSAPNDLAIASNVAFIAGSGTDRVFRDDLISSALVSSAKGALPAGSDPARIAATDAHTAWVSLLGANQIAKVVFP